jgi:hypothetical protein
MKTDFRIYAKTRNMKTFKAFDASTGSVVDNLIYATYFKAYQYDKVKAYIDAENQKQDAVIFELRGV